MFFRKLAQQIIQRKKLLENTAVAAAIGGSAYFQLKYQHKWVEREIKLFKSALSPEEKMEMNSSPEKNEKYKNRCKEEIRQNMMSSVL